MTAKAASYENLTNAYRDISSLSGISGILEWDEQVMMPTGAANSRAKQKAALAAILHEKSTSHLLKSAIDAAKTDLQSLNSFEKAVVRDAERRYLLAVGVPTSLEKEIAEQEVASVQTWIAARSNNDFNSYAPHLETMLQLMKKKAIAMKPDHDPYGTLIDCFERGMSAERLTEIFEQISSPLKVLLEKVFAAKESCSKTVHPALLGGEDWDVAKQAQLSREICKVLGFDFDKGRIDVSVHPFTGGSGPTDVRITTRYSKELPFEGIMGTVHETGHAMYEQGRNAQYEGLPVSDALSMGVHESQSLFWERMIGQNIGFWEAVLPVLHEKMPHTKSASAEDFFFAVNQVNRGLIRVEADELTYPFHIILRFELEKKLLAGTLAASDLPQAWAEGMKKHLGVEVPSDKDGSLQDIHWPSGAFGYFPSYTLGAMMAAQLFAHMKKVAMPDIESKIQMGEYADIREWLRKNIHEVGSLYPSLDELLQSVMDEPLNPQYFLDYLEEKYSKVYA